MLNNPFSDKYQTDIELSDINQNALDDDTEINLEGAKRSSLFSFTQKSDWGLMILGFICSAISALGTPVQTIIYGRIFTKLTDFYLIEYTDRTEFIKDVGMYCVMIIVVGVVKLIFSLLMVVFWMRNGENHQKRTRKLIFSKILSHGNVEWIENFKNVNGELTQLNRCVEELRTGNAELLGLLAQAAVAAVALFIVAMVFSWSVTLVTLALSPVFALTSWLTGKLAYKYANKENEYTSLSVKIVNWCLLNPAIVRLFNGKDIDMINFKNLINKCSSFNYKLENVVNFNIGILKCFSLLMFVQGFWFGNTMIRLRHVDINQVFTAFSACLMLASAIAGITELVGDIYRAQAAIGKIKEFLSLNSHNEDDNESVDKMSPTWCNGAIQFKDVQFKYEHKPEIILNNFNLTLKANEFNFIIGKSGSGKSTLAQLIMKFYKPNGGEVLIDGFNINRIDENWINSNVTLIQLNPIIFNQSLKDNLCMAILNKYRSLEDIPDSIVEDAIEFSLLDKLLKRIGGMDKPISSSTLSGGEKQRIAIARAKLRNTPILILDEGLSALDYGNRKYLFNAIKDWRQGKTTIFITHQLDQIDPQSFTVIIEDGKVKNQGYMAELADEPLIKDYTKLASGSSKASVDTSLEDEETLHESVKRFSYKNYNYLKNPIILKDLESTPILQDESIYPLSKILFYCLRTVNSKFFIVLGLFFSVIHAVSNPVFSYLFSRLLDNMMDTAIGINVSSRLKFWSCIVIGVSIINGLSYYLSNFLLAVSSERWVNQLRKLSLMKINDQDLSFFLQQERNRTPSEINALLMNDTRDLRTMVSKFLSVTISLVVLVLLGCIFAIVLGWRLALTGIAFVVVIVIVTFFYARVMQRSETGYKNKINELETINYEAINGIKTIHSFDLKNFFVTEFATKMDLIDKAAFKRSMHTGASIALKDTLVSIATGIILYYGMRLASSEEYDRLQLLQVITLLMMTFITASTFLNELPDITRGQRCGTYIMKLLQLSASKVETCGDAKPVKPVKDQMIRFSAVDFSYSPSSKDILNNVSFTIKEKDIFGIVGESGSGKSTIINLITKLYGNYQGIIELNATPLEEINVEWLRDYVSIVPQSPVFFEGTIYDNLTYGMPKDKLVHSNIEEFLSMCNIDSFINSLSSGLRTNIGSLTENSLISTGQLQRLAMVRALIRQPKILILDECTSNLDLQNFNLFKDLIVRLNAELGITIILISHSSELLSITTNSIQLNHGRII